jgi:spermidine/putrescine transport system ATP-binding protein
MDAPGAAFNHPACLWLAGFRPRQRTEETVAPRRANRQDRVAAQQGDGSITERERTGGGTGTETEVEIRSVSKIFGSRENSVTALDDVSLAIARGEFFTLLGPSGCGKTTLLRAIAGFETPTTGSIHLEGKDITALGPNRRPVNTVFQSYALFPHMSVAENIAFGLKMLGKPRAEVEATTAGMLRLVRMEALADRRPAQISGGQQQRVALARALAPRPRVLLLDEPLSALDLKLRKEMQGELKRLQAETGITFVFVTHDQEEALTMSDRIGVMSGGRLLQVGPPREIYDHPAERFVADFIGDTNILQAEVMAIGPAGAEIRLPSGSHHAASLPPGMTPAPGERVSIVIRPEHAALDDDGPLRGRLERTVFFGTDTHFHLRLDSGEPFTLRRQNGALGLPDPATGEAVALRIADGAIQILRA